MYGFAGVSEDDANEAFLQQSLQASTLSLDMDDPESTLHAQRELTSAGTSTRMPVHR